MNFKQVAIVNNEVPVFSSTVVHQLVSAIANGMPAVHDGVTYTAHQVAQMLKNQSAGVKPTKVSIFAGDYCMTQGIVVEPYFPDEDYPSYPISSTANSIDLPIQELPVTGGALDLENVSIGGKRYYLPLSVKEDIKQFAALFKYAESSALQRKTWSYLVSTSSVWSQHGFYSRELPFELLEHIKPDRAMSGQDLIEFLYLNKHTWPFVRTVVWAMLKDVTVPEVDQDGEPVYDSDGELEEQYANGEIDVIQGENTFCFLDRLVRPPPIMFKCSSDKYQAEMQIDKVKEQLSVSTLLETHNDYYDGIDYSINCNNIRAKITILGNLDLDPLPNRIGVVTNQKEEFLVFERFFKNKYEEKEVIHLTEKSSHNFSGFKIFMKPTSAQMIVEIHDKATVTRSMQKNASLIKAIRAGEYPDGLGFMTSPLLGHFQTGQEPSEKKGPGIESEYIDLPEGRAFKQLDSALPLMYYPYISGLKAVVDAWSSREHDVILNLKNHLWTLVNYPVTRATFCETFDELASPVYIKWTPGKTAASLAFELDSSFEGGVRVVKDSRLRKKPKDRHVRVEETYEKKVVPPKVDISQRIVQKPLPEKKESEKIEPPVEKHKVAPVAESKVSTTKSKSKNQKKEIKKIRPREKVEIDASEMSIDSNSDDEDYKKS